MTNKQIIIDGVPVQDCCYFNYENDGYEDSCYIHQNECSAQNCYYKQLKRKEQECEELKRLIAKQKNAKIQLSKLKDKQYKEFCDMKQTLTEIKEIVETENNDIKVLYNRRTYQRMKQILQKISECEVE